MISEMVELKYFESKPPDFNFKRRRIIRISVITVVCLLAIYFAVYSFTDAIFGPQESLNSDSIRGEWAMFRHDMNRTGTTATPGTAPEGTLAWTFPTEGPIYSSPAVVDGVVYFGSRDGKVYALDAVTGKQIWAFQSGNWVDSSPTVVNGRVYFGSNDGNFYALKASTGEKLWEYYVRYPIRSSAAVAGDMVYFGCYDYSIYALDTATGKKRWSYETGSYVYSSPVIKNGILYVCSLDNFLYALHARSGRLRLRFRSFSPTTVTSSPIALEDSVYFASSDGFMYAVDGFAKNWPGELRFRPLWTHAWILYIAPHPPQPSGYLWRAKLGKEATSSPAYQDGTMYIGAANKLVSLDMETQNVGWEYETDSDIESSPSITEKDIYAVNENGKLFALDNSDGTLLWDLQLGNGIITSSPALANGMIYVGSQNGNLYAVK